MSSLLPDDGLAEPDLWEIHEPVLRQLYIEQKLTLKAVKETAEAKYGFPAGLS